MLTRVLRVAHRTTSEKTESINSNTKGALYLQRLFSLSNESYPFDAGFVPIEWNRNNDYHGQGRETIGVNGGGSLEAEKKKKKKLKRKRNTRCVCMSILSKMYGVPHFYFRLVYARA